MTKQQIQWAMQHDWYSHSNGDVVYVIERVVHTDRHGVKTNAVKPFNDYQELRAWAGY